MELVWVGQGRGVGDRGDTRADGRKHQGGWERILGGWKTCWSGLSDGHGGTSDVIPTRAR